jgi:hypothetical protein
MFYIVNIKILFYKGEVNNYPQCSCICVSVGSSVVLRSIAMRGCHYFCAGLMLLGQFHRRCLAVNHGCSAFCLHQRRAMFSDPVFVVGRDRKSVV